jgi:hypothetical protein
LFSVSSGFGIGILFFFIVIQIITGTRSSVASATRRPNNLFHSINLPIYDTQTLLQVARKVRKQYQFQLQNRIELRTRMLSTIRS